MARIDDILLSERDGTLTDEESSALATLREAGQVPEPLPPEESFGHQAARFAVRTALPVAGGIVGSAGGPVGTAAGAALGGAVGQDISNWMEGKPRSLKEDAVAGVVAAIPAGPIARYAPAAKSWAGALLLHGAEGAYQGAAAKTIEAGAEGRLPTGTELATGAAGGAVVGGATGVVAHAIKARGGRAAVATETPVPVEAVPAETPPEPGMIRLYRGQVQRGGKGYEQNPSYVGGGGASPEFGASFFATDPTFAEQYAAKARANGHDAELVYVDLTPGEWTEAQVAAQEGGLAHGEYQLAPDALARARVASGVAEPAATTAPREGLAPSAYESRPEAGDPKAMDAYVDRVFADHAPAVRDGLKTVFRDHADEMATQGRGVQTVRESRDLSRTVPISPDDIVAPGTAANAEQVHAITDVTREAFLRVHELEQALERGEDVGPDLQNAHLNLIRMATTLKGVRAESGRSLRAFREPATFRQRFISGMLDTGATPEKIAEAMKQAGDDPLKQYRALLDAGRVDSAEFRKGFLLTNMLAGPKTIERNGFGNLFRGATDVATKTVAAGIDVVKHVTTGAERTTYFSEPGAMVLHGAKSIPQGIKTFLQVMGRGFSDMDVAESTVGGGKWEVSPKAFEPRAGRPVFNAATALPRYVSRLLDGTDQFFRTVSGSMHLNASALAKATSMAEREKIGTRGSAERAKYIADLAAEYVINPPDDLRAEMNLMADRSVFHEKNPFAHALVSMVDKYGTVDVPLIGPIPVGRMVIPFVKTPANIIKQGFQMSPAGLVTRRAWQGGRAGTQAQAEAAFGTAVLGGAVWLAASGNMTGAAPRDPGKRDAFLAKHPENAVLVGGRWHTFDTLGPLAIPLTLAANFVQAAQERGVAPTDEDALGLTKDVLTAMQASGASIFRASYLSGLGDLIDTVQDPKQHPFANYAAGRATQLIPAESLLRTATQATDDTLRQPEGFVDAVKTVIPGLSQTVRPRLDALGQEVQRGTPGVQALHLSGKKIGPDRLREELENIGLHPTLAPAKSLRYEGEALPITSTQDVMIRKAIGTQRRALLEDVLADRSYLDLPENERKDYLKKEMAKITSTVHRAASEALLDGRDVTEQDLAP